MHNLQRHFVESTAAVSGSQDVLRANDGTSAHENKLGSSFVCKISYELSYGHKKKSVGMNSMIIRF